MQPVPSALLLHVGALGDFVLALRVAQALRPNAAHLAMSGHASHLRLALRAGIIDRGFDWESAAVQRLFHGDCAAPPAEPGLGRHELTINMLAGGTQGPTAEQIAKCTRGRVIDVPSAPREDCIGHIANQWLHDAHLLATHSECSSTHPMPPSDALLRDPVGLHDTAQGRGGPIAIHPGSGGEHRCWPLENFMQLAVELRNAGHLIQLLLGDAELERWSPHVISRLRQEFDTLAVPALPDLARQLTLARAYIGNDSGVSHLAAAVGAPTIAIFGPTDPLRWRPLGPHVRALRSASPGAWPAVSEVLGACEEWLA